MTTETYSLHSLADLDSFSRDLTELLDQYVDEFEDSTLANIIFKEMPLEWHTVTVRKSGADWRDLLYDSASECGEEARALEEEAVIGDARVVHQLEAEVAAANLAVALNLLLQERKAAA